MANKFLRQNIFHFKRRIKDLEENKINGGVVQFAS